VGELTMALYGPLSAPIAGMLAQTSAFGAISDNITNSRTGGYKSTEVRFQTQFSTKFFDNSDIGGILPIRVNNIEQQGVLNSTDDPNNIAISGKGLFVLNTKVDGTGETLYTRDGQLQLKTAGTETITGFLRDNGTIDTISETGENEITFTIDKSFLADKNGNFVQGWPANELGVINTAAAPTAMRVDQFAFISDSSATTTATLEVTLPATSAAGSVEKAKASIFDANGELKSLEFVWTKGLPAQEWTLTIAPVEGTSTSTGTFTFGTDGRLPAGTTTPFDVTWDDGQTSAVTLDISNTRSLASRFFYTEFQKNGRSPGDLLRTGFDEKGDVNGFFSNGVERILYKMPLATFTNTNGLELQQGNTFSESVLSGTPLLREADAAGVAKFVPFFHETSNTDLGSEFQAMILTQQAYNSSATVFKTVDEMTSVAAELKA
jgi:flagellar hook protein FlgE